MQSISHNQLSPCSVKRDRSLTGKSFIGYKRGAGLDVWGAAVNPATRAALQPEITAVTAEELQTALEHAEAAFMIYREKSGVEKATFLRAIAVEVEDELEEIVARGMLETGLAEARMRGEAARTIGQLELYANLVEDGSWVDARIEHAGSEQKPTPLVDLRSMVHPLGPVVVFAASNFPLAYSVCGGDTASALAAGCPVIVKAHSSHPGVSEIVARAIIKAAQDCQMPEGVFSMVYGSGKTVGQAIVSAPQIKAVGFTGSRAGGRALMDIAAQRPEPIPVYAEMSSINPVVVLGSALGERSEALAASFFDSLSMGVGQFCTNPGLVFLPAEGSEFFINQVAALAAVGQAGTMLNAAICQAYHAGVAALMEQNNVEMLAYTKATELGQASPAVFRTTAAEFLNNKALAHEVFGPCSLLVTYCNEPELMALCESLDGQLTASVLGSEEDFMSRQKLVNVLERKAGRLIYNGFPTGVRVCHAIVHGGPYPATSDGRSTSVGSNAIYRFTRLVCYQNFPDSALPAELKEGNPLKIARIVDGGLCER